MRRSHILNALFLLSASLILQATVFAYELDDLTGLAQANSAAVVNISTKQSGKLKGMVPHGLEIPDLPEDSPFRDFLKRFFGDELGDLREFEAQSLGSGFAISNDGYILTNHHVIADADEILVRLSDRREFTAEFIGSDKASDVALIKIDATDLPVLKIGKSSDVKVGEWVVAIGSPFGFDHSVTAGIVSAKGRSLPSENYTPFIQTDVAINPGNSGGPLFNLDGEVVGVNSQIYSRTGGYMGLSFAIPIELAMNVAEQLRSKGRVTRGYLGVLIQDVTRELAESFGMEHPRGALVAKVIPDGPAAAAGIRAGDVVLRFNGRDVLNSAQLPPLVGASSVGKSAKLVVLRGGKERTLSVDIAELPGEEEVSKTATPTPAHEERLGLVVADLPEAQAEELGLQGGVVVSEVGQGPARLAGIRTGDVILMLNNQPVDDAEQFGKILREQPTDRPVAVLIQRDQEPLFLALRLPEE